MEFVETTIFTDRIKDLITDDEYALLQLFLMKNPKAGLVIPQGKGLRKLRWRLRDTGKKGGLRVIYYCVTEDALYMIFPYKKSGSGSSTQDDLTGRQLKMLTEYVKDGAL